MRWEDFFRIEPLESDEVPGGVVGWHVIRISDGECMTADEPYGEKHYLLAVNTAKFCLRCIDMAADRIILG